MIEGAQEYGNNEICQAIEAGKDYDLLTEKIEVFAEEYATSLNSKITSRKGEIKHDDNFHYVIYRELGIAFEHGQLTHEYQNEGRFLYKYADSFLEDAASLFLKFENISGGKKIILNNQSQKPTTFEIDFLDGKNAIEIKWKDATTDGNHTEKEHTRVKVIASHAYVPIRIMFYYSLRSQ